MWNASASRLWNNTVQVIRRSLAELGAIAQSKLNSVAQFHYLKVAEMQRRGLIHFHAILRADGPDDLESAVPFWLTSEILASSVRGAVLRAAVTGLDGRTYRWGEIFDIQDLGLSSEDAGKVASYVAKYATKTTDGSTELAYRFHSRRQIRILVDDSHFRRLALTAWDLSNRPGLIALHLREHANMFGFSGQLITKSRHYSTTFIALRSKRAEHMKSRNSGDPIDGTFLYEGRGYDDPRGSDLAQFIFSSRREIREESLRKKKLDSDCE